MSDEPIRLLDLPPAASGGASGDLPSVLARADLAVARDHAPVDYDVDDGLERFRGLIAAGGSGPGSGAEPPGGLDSGAAASAAGATTAAGAKSGTLWAALAIGVIGGGVAIAVVNETSTGAPPSAVTAPMGDSPEGTTATTEGSLAEPEAPRAPLAGDEAPPPEDLEAAAPPASAHNAPQALPHPAPASSIGAEMAHLAELRALAGSDPARALALADEGHARFPKGTFGQEREAIAISALARLGRTEQAQQRARAFLARHPESPFSESIQNAAGL